MTHSFPAQHIRQTLQTAAWHRICTVASLLVFALLLPLAAQAKINVVATTPDLAAIAKQVGGDKVEVTTLARPTEDPHFIDAKPSFVVKLRRADALVDGGAELET